MNKILKEIGFQQTGCTDAECVIEMGRIVGVGKMVAGSINLVGDIYYINIQLINVATATIEAIAEESCENCRLDDLLYLMEPIANKLMGELGERKISRKDVSKHKIAFTSTRDGNNEIYVMNADGTNPVNLTNNTASDMYPAWSFR